MARSGLTPGEVFARDFRVVRPLAEGGMGAVYVVEQLSTRKTRALKIMRGAMALDPGARARFTREAQAAGAIDSDHVVEVVAAGVDEASDTPWLAMELLEGEDLAAVLERQGALAPADVLAVFRQLCDGIAAAHRRGLVHRDLKPENVFLARARRRDVAFTLKVLDFGIAKFTAQARTGGGNTQSLGSPLWMAPEQVDAAGEISPATDVWALGLIAYRLLTGGYYWLAAWRSDASVVALIREIVMGPLPLASERAREFGREGALPHGFDAWFAGCVARDPAQRYRDAAAVLAALEPVLAGAPHVANAAAAAHPLAPTEPGAALVPTVRAGDAPVATFPGAALLEGTPAGAHPPTPSASRTVAAPPPAAAFTPAPASPVTPAPPPRRWPLAVGTVALAVVAGVVALRATRGRPAVSAATTTTSGTTAPRASTATPDAAPVATPPPASVVLGDLRGSRAGHYCARTPEGVTRCWGPNERGALGDGTTLARFEPTALAAEGTWAEITPGGENPANSFTCARRGDGAVFCWGSNTDGQLGDGTTTDRARPAPVPGVTGATRIATGGYHACAVVGDAAGVRCWGSNAYGQLGDGTTTDRRDAVAVTGLAGVVELALGANTSCARTRDNAVSCWGSLVHGNAPTRVPALAGAIALRVQYEQMCALTDEGAVRCVGTPPEGTTASPGALVARDVPALPPAADLALGREHACIAARDGAVLCWGSNWRGELGDGTRTRRGAAVRARGVSDAVQVAAGENSSCARTRDGRAFCWGSGEAGSLGDGVTPWRATPEPPRGLTSGVSQVSVGERHVCALREDGAVLCWGENEDGMLGDGSTVDRTEPTAVRLAGPARAVSVGGIFGPHSCALLGDGAVRCWGSNVNGQVGDGGADARATATPVRDLAGVLGLSAGGEHACAVRADHGVSCWGQVSVDARDAEGGRVGHRVPAPVAGITDAAAVATGPHATCVLRDTDRGAWCFGGNARGRLGAGARALVVDAPARFAVTLPVSSVAIGETHACVIVAGEAVWCAGRNERGQLGDGTTTDRETPVLVRGLGGARQIALGSAHACAVLSDQTVQCWGANERGQLGVSGGTDTSTPVTVPGLADATQISAGASVTCATLRSGALRCWGDGTRGQLGDGTSGRRTAAVPVRWR